MKQSLLLVLCLLTSALLFGQNHILKGKIVDHQNRTAILSAHLTLSNSSGLVKTSVTDAEGEFVFERLQSGNYELIISYVGYRDLKRGVKIVDTNIDLGVLELKGGVDLEEVEVTAKVVPVEQKGDTLQLNAAAYKTLPDASAEEMLEKMPTVDIDNGKVQAQGENVNRVLVDGKPFFGNDPTAALRNLPAEVIDKIQIFDQQSDQAQFTGFDDGNETKTINIITKPNMRNGQFGKVYGGYGYADKYTTGGNINIFNGDQRISLIGQSNNINIQNFATEDLLGVVGSSGSRRRGFGGGGRGRRGGGRGGRNQGASVNDFLVPQQDGVATTHAFGVNYSDKWGKKMEVNGSYFFNLTDNLSEEILLQNFVDQEEVAESYLEENKVESSNQNHRLNGRLTYKINDKNSLIMRPSLSWQNNDGRSATLGENLLNDRPVSESLNNYLSDLRGFNFNNNLLWRHQFEKRRRTFSINLSNGFAPKSGASNLFSQTQFFRTTTKTDTLDQQATLDLNNWNIGTNFQYTEPLGQNAMLMLNYRLSYQQEDSDRSVFDFSTETASYDLFNEQLSNIFSNDYQTHRLGGGYNWRKRKTMFMLRANVQYAALINEPTFPTTNTISNTFLNVLPMAILRMGDRKSKNLTFFYRTNTQLPSIEQLQNVLDNSNPLQLSIGNPDLVQSFQHRVFARYSNTNAAKSSVFFALLSGTFTKNYIGNSLYFSDSEAPIFDELGLDNNAQLSLPVNLNGYWNARSLVTYGFPVELLSSNLNIDFNANHSRIPGLIEDAINYANNSSIGLGLTLGSNISEQLDFTIVSRSNYNITQNSLQLQVDNIYWSQRTRLKINWIVGDGWIFRTQLTHQYFNGLANTVDQNFVLWNASFGRKLFEKDRGEISISAFDLLNQNINVNRTVTETYIEDTQTNALQQYFMLHFKYDIRHFRVK
ncbi:MAG: outer membrane beta-barrel protein [Bacteroidota bacterium]